MRALRLAGVLACCISMFAACGGGGSGGSSSGSGGGNNPPPPPPRGAFTLSASTASFEAVSQGTPAAAQAFDITLTGSGTALVGAAYVGGQAPAPWLSMNITGSGTAYRLNVSAGNWMPAGLHTASFTVGTADAAGVVLQQQTFTVQLRIYSRVQINNVGFINRNYIFGDAPRTDSISLNVQGPERSWTFYSEAPWIQVPAQAFNGAAQSTATIDLTGLAPGTYSGRVGARDSADVSNYQSIPVSIVVTEPTFSITQQDVLFGGEDGLTPLATAPVNFTLTTGNGVHPYTATVTTDSDGAWLQVSNPAGTVGAAGASVNLSVAPGTLLGATRTAQLRVSTNVYGTNYTQTIPVTWNHEAKRLVTSANGVALSSVPGRDVLTRTLKVFGNAANQGTPWTAQSNAPWLSVTPSGTTDGDLVLTANPAGLAVDTTHFAEVTVNSSDQQVVNSQSVRVGLYVTNTPPVTVDLQRIATHMAASPVEPLVAITGGGTDIEIYNVYSGALVRTLTQVAAGPAAVKFSGDGSRLLVYDSINLNVRSLNSLTGAQLASYDSTSISDTYRGRAIDTVRPGGAEIVITPGGKIYDLTTGEYFSNAPYFPAVLALSLAHSPDQRLVVPQFGSVGRFNRTALRGGRIEIEANYRSVLATDSGETCFGITGDRVYATYFNGDPHHIVATSLATGQSIQEYPTGGYWPASVRCAWNGLVIGGAQITNNTDEIVMFYGPTGIGRGTLRANAGIGPYGMTLLARGLEVSGDATRLMALYGGYANQQAAGITIQALPTPQ